MIVNISCPKDLQNNNGMFYFDTSKYFEIKFQLKFLKQNNKFFLSNKQIFEITEEPNYYKVTVNFEEGFLADDLDNSIFLSTSFYMDIKGDVLYLTTIDPK